MPTNISIVLDFLERCNQKISTKSTRGAKPTYSNASMVLFFIIVIVKKHYAFKAMEKFAKLHFKSFGWTKSPSRKTIRRRFLELPPLLQVLMPTIAHQCDELNHQVFGHSQAFVDKSIFKAKGGIWHKNHIKLNIIPHKSIDSEASWGFSPYHKWRFGYGLHLIANENRFPIVACVTTAKIKDYLQVPILLNYVSHKIGVLVGDAGYFAIRIIQKVHQTNDGLLYTRKIFTEAKTSFKQFYNDIVNTAIAQLLYRKRKPSIEPTFSLIKEIYQLQGQKQLPYRGLKKNDSFLMLTVVSIQLMMYLNFLHKQELGSTNTLVTLL